MMSGRGRLPGVIAAVVLAALAAGCGSVSSGGSSGGGSGGGGSSDSKTLRIGLSGILSGPAASAGQGTDAGVQAYFKAVNAKGGIDGYRFSFTTQDNAYDSAKSATVARNFVNGGVNFIVTEGTAPVQATAPVATAANVPIVAELDGGLFKPPGDKYKSSYAVNPVYAEEAHKGADWILNGLHQKSAALVYLDAEGESQSKAAFTGYFQAHGGKVVDTEAIQLTSTDYSAFARKLKASGAKVVYAFVFDAQLPGLQKAAAAIGYHPHWVGWFDVYSPSYLQLAGNLATGVDVSLFVPPVTQTSDPAVRDYVTAMKRYYPSQLKNPPAEQGWTIAAIIARGVKQATAGGKKYSPDAFNAALQTFSDTQVGLLKGITYDDQTHSGATRAAMYRIQTGGGIKQLSPFAAYPK